MTVTALDRGVHFDAAGNSAMGNYRISGISWTGGANTNTCVINDQDDNLIWQGEANTGQLDFPFVPLPNLKVTQIKVATLDAGELIVFT